MISQFDTFTKTSKCETTGVNSKIFHYLIVKSELQKHTAMTLAYLGLASSIESNKRTSDNHN